MSRFKSHKHHHSDVIALDRDFMPMMEVSRRKAMKALATGRAMALDLSTWSKLGLRDVAGRAFNVIVFPRAHMIQDSRLGFGRDNRAILKRDAFKCQYKGCDKKATTVDHVIPKCQGGRATWGNLVAACQPCNSKKGGRTPAEANMELKTPVRSPRFHLMDKFRTLVEQAA